MTENSAQFKKNLAKLANRTLEQEAELVRIEREAFARFEGQFDELETALGMLRLGHHLGWRPLVLIHNKRTIRNFEKTLGVNIRELFPAEGPSCERSVGYMLAKKIGNFWKAVSGAVKIDNRREIASKPLEEA